MPKRNKSALESFVAYCAAHPEERFWQALNNWSGQTVLLLESRGSIGDQINRAAGVGVDLSDPYHLEQQ